mgnify:CR=1 FL=1
MKDKLAEYDTNYKVLDPKTSKFHEHDALGLYGNQEEGIYWVITNLVRSESNELKSLYASGESGWGYATYLDSFRNVWARSNIRKEVKGFGYAADTADWGKVPMT